MKNLKIKIYLLPSKMNETNEAPIYLGIILDSKYVQLSTGIFVKSEFWDRKKKDIKAKHPDAVRLNLQVAKAKEKLFDIHYNLQRNGKSSLEKIKEIWSSKGEKSNTILALLDYNNDLIKTKIGQSYALNTYNHYRSLRKTVAAFISGIFSKPDFDIEDLNLAFITKFEHYLSSTNHNCVNTIAKQIDRLKKVINVGIKNDWLKDDR